MKLYHFHLSEHEAVYAESEGEAREELMNRRSVTYADFELTDVQDVADGE